MRCFDRLGLRAETSTHASVRKAYRRLARRTHPDRVPPNQRERAKAAFHVLHEAYLEALEYIKQRDGRDGVYNNTRSRQQARTEPPKARESLREMFQSVSAEIDAGYRDQHRATVDRLYEQIVASRDDTDKCWQLFVSTTTGLLSFGETMVMLEKNGFSELASRLRHKYSEWEQAFYKKEAEAASSIAQYVKDQWPNKRVIGNYLLREMNFSRKQQALHHLTDTEMRDFVGQYAKFDYTEYDPTPRLKRLADEIGKAFPNRQHIKQILAEVMPGQRHQLFGYLREEHLELCVEIFGSVENGTPPLALQG